MKTRLEEFIALAKETKQDRDSLLFPLLRSNIIGLDATLNGPFGTRQIVYADYFASGKSLEMVEDHIRQVVMPYYANTHTDATETGALTTHFREQARDIICSSVNGNTGDPKSQSHVIFCGSGSTAAINKLVHMFRLREKYYWEKFESVKDDDASVDSGVEVDDVPSKVSRSPSKFSLQKIKSLMGITNQKDGEFFQGVCPDSNKPSTFEKLKNMFAFKSYKKPVVFISVQEHHANILPWRSGTVADIVLINNASNGLPCMDHLESMLKKYHDRPLKIGSFTAGSNLVGILLDTTAISTLLHKYGAYAILDFAGVGSYVPIDMNSSKMGYYDAVVLSPHKMIGGPQTPGVLVIRAETMNEIRMQNNGQYNPSQVGGGIVEFVDAKTQVWVDDVTAVEETGTPAIIESIRAGLVFAVKDAIGSQFIMDTELLHFKHIHERLAKIPNFNLVGNLDHQRIPVISFTLNSDEGPDKFYHYNFITVLLNDLFGIQSRGGCMCAALFGKELLQIKEPIFKEFGKIVTEKSYAGIKGGPFLAYKPGFVRLSFNYFISDQEMEYILQALEWVSANAGKMLRYYDYSIISGVWKYRGDFASSSRSLIQLAGQNQESAKAPSLDKVFEYADEIANQSVESYIANSFKDEEELKNAILANPEFEKLRWFTF